MNALLSLILITACSMASGQTFFSVEGDLSWQSRNDQRVPGNSGTDFSISDFDTGPFPAYRVYLGHIWNDRHELRALYAPLEFETSGRFSKQVTFVNTDFAADTRTEISYKFNSYRLTYAYHFDPNSDWKFALGFTGKIRDARVRVSQGTLSDQKSNVGFVPLVNFQAHRDLGENWRFRFDIDGLAAPQGRAFDAALFFERLIKEESQLCFFFGYRTIEGGADNDKVYNFAWIHKAVVGLRKEL